MPNAVLFDALTTVQTAIQGLSLSGIANDHILVQKVISTSVKDLPATEFPCVLIAPFGKEDMLETGTNLRDDIVYPIVAAIFAADDGSQTSNFNAYLTWREQIRKAFYNKNPFSSIMSVYQSKIQPLDIVDLFSWDKLNLFASGFLLQVYSREART